MVNKKLIIIGNGMAPGRMLEHLLDRQQSRESASDNGAVSGWSITIFNAEDRVNYNRLMLSPVLSGEKTYEEIITHDDTWYREQGITLHKATMVESIDREQRQVTAGGEVFDYDRLVIATGSAPILLPLPGHDLDGVLCYRDADDVARMVAMGEGQETTSRAVVIGGGLLGLEAAAGLCERGWLVTVVHLAGHLMERQLDPAASWLLEQEMKQRGVRIITGANTRAIHGELHVTGVELDDGEQLPADMVVMAVGIRPATQLASECGLETGRGIMVNDYLQTSDAAIYALGECVEHRGICYGLVAPLYEMARTLAAELDCVAQQALREREAVAPYNGSLLSTKLKVSGVDLFSAGEHAVSTAAGTLEEIVLRDARAQVYKRLVLQDDKIVGVVLYGDTTDGAWYFDLLKRKEDISAQRETLIYGQAYQGGAALDPTDAVAALPDDAEICGCNGVCKQEIVSAVKQHSLTTIDEVRAHTKASSSCGTCSGLVEQVMALTLGDKFRKNAVVSVCGCTTLSHDDVRLLIRVRKLKSIPAVMQSLQWQSSCGCARCRPALNYYLVCEWPGEYQDDAQSRFINERVHANIQKDGTYSVVPRMWGGMTSSSQLRAIADVVDKFEIPAVKVTGGQRIDMLGIKKDDLPAVWSDLSEAGFVSGHAYAKGLRTVKTCVGTDWCRFGTQDSTGLGIRLERLLWCAWSPAKVKLAVSGCPRNCAEATCKDIGIVCVDSGYDIHFAGAAGLDVRQTELLCHVDTEAAVFEHVMALLQMYREQGHYLERIYKWARRVGSEHIQQQIVESADQRKAYVDAFEFAQSFVQDDPWHQRVRGEFKHEFEPLVPSPAPVAAVIPIHTSDATPERVL